MTLLDLILVLLIAASVERYRYFKLEGNKFMARWSLTALIICSVLIFLPFFKHGW